jgi:hypothetical protein
MITSWRYGLVSVQIQYDMFDIKIPSSMLLVFRNGFDTSTETVSSVALGISLKFVCYPLQ